MRPPVTVAACRVITVAVALAAVFALAVTLAACGEGDNDGSTPVPTATVTVTETASPAPSPVDTTDPSAITTVALYLLRGETLGVAHRAVPATGAPATAAMDALLEGPDKREKTAGLGTAIPVGTTLNGIVIEDGTARVDLSEEFASGGGSLSMQARVAQVVYTLTQFRTVKRVDFLIDGARVETLGGEGLMLDAGQRRADWRDFLPAIFVESPAVGDVVSGSLLTVRGSASVWEATFQCEVIDGDGQTVSSQTVTASRGAPGRGGFSATLRLDSLTGRGRLVAYEVSMEDGSRMNEIRIPLRFADEE